MSGILVFAESRSGQIKKSSIEAICEAKRISGELNCAVSALIAGCDAAAIAGQLTNLGVKVLIAEHKLLSEYNPDAYMKAITTAADKVQPEYVFFSATSIGKELAAKLSANKKSGTANDCIKIEITGKELSFIRPIYAGKALSKIKITTSLKIASLRPNVFSDIPANTSASVSEILNIDLKEEELKARSKGFIESGETKIELTEANVVVAGGRGMKTPENFKMIDNLAETLNGAIGASRAVVDANWKTHECQVGQTGKTVSPNLYIACGISGAIQHLAGMTSSKYIIAINKDPDAPIFKYSDYGIVGDCMEIIPLLTEEIKKLKN